MPTDEPRTFRRGIYPRRGGTFGVVMAGLLIAVGCGEVGNAERNRPTSTTTTSTSATAVPPSQDNPATTLVWADEFDGPAGSAPDPSKWTAVVGGTGWGNRELQYYTDRRANARLDGRGHLVITALSALSDGSGGLSCWYGPCRYTSARLTTHRKFSRTYGRFQARIKISSGHGVWPAFWLLGENIDEVGWPQAGEIDIMEHDGRDARKTIGALHGPEVHQVFPYWFDRPVTDDFHVFAVDWTHTEIAYSVDGKTFGTMARTDPGWVFDHPFHILINMAIGGNFPGDPGDTTFPRDMLVDYVRVFSTSST